MHADTGSPTGNVRVAIGVRAWLSLHRRDVEDMLFGMTLIGWGVVVMLPGTIVDSTPGLETLVTLIPEWLAGAIWASVGVLMFTTALGSRRTIRSMLALVAAGLWAFVAWNFALVDPVSTAVPVYTMLAVGETWMYLRRSLFNE